MVHGPRRPEDIPIPTSKLGPAWQPAPPAPGEIVYSGCGVRTRPAPAGLTTAISAEQAMRLVEGLWRGMPEVELRLVTTGDFPGSPAPDRLVDRPAWVFTYPDTTVPLHGRGGAGRSMPGTATVVIDAETGAQAANFHVGHGPDGC